MWWRVAGVCADVVDMPFIGSIIPAQVAGLSDRKAARARERDERRRVESSGAGERSSDEAELTSVEAVEESGASEAVQGADSEAGAEDREAHGYTASGAVRGARPRIDLEG